MRDDGGLEKSGRNDSNMIMNKEWSEPVSILRVGIYRISSQTAGHETKCSQG